MQVSRLSNVTAAAADYAESFAITSDGQLWVWGNNREGQLGLGAATDIETVPVKVTALSEFRVKGINANEWHVVAYTEDGSLWAWGRNNDYGQLGNGSLLPSAAPVRVTIGPPEYQATAVRLGSLHRLAQLADGQLALWGNNWYGQLGDKRSIDPKPMNLYYVASWSLGCWK
ncbi:hypothetical protein GWK36_13680 [Caldichromatium japonicum]|uniref:Uncharacterized protein n=1 Tax=Caldichromatium japonicum TaxID=2699430 RepID=A0A6G7VFJ7_9GAMM|nr:hypothetical protein [Caldichromatium japonicum]QIK38853.1 hypothetical protein GWK36_13680 [Caldichromatium japonicum]